VEASDRTGGVVRSEEVTAPGFVTDIFSSSYPLAAASPVIRWLQLEEYGLVWAHAPAVLAHALDDGRAVQLSRDADMTAASMDSFGAGDGDAWLALFAQRQRIRDPIVDALFSPLPPVRALTRVLRRVGTSGALDLARLGVLPVRRLARERFRGVGAELLLVGKAMHSDVPPDAAGSGVFGWLLAMLGQDVGFPVPRQGAGALADALTRRAQARGVHVRTGSRVTSVEVSHGGATAVCLEDGTRVPARKAVLADVAAPLLFRDLVGAERLPPRLLRDLDRFQFDHPTMMVNWALDCPVPWTADDAHGAGTVHLGVDADGFVDVAADLSVGREPRRPFVLFGQMTTADSTRSPAGTESAWAYTHVPAGADWSGDRLDRQVDRLEQAVERVAVSSTPGWPGTSSRQATWSVPTRTSSVARSMRELPPSTSSWCSGPPLGWVGPRPRFQGCTWRARRRIRAAASTAHADGTPRGALCPTRRHGALCADGWSIPPVNGSSRLAERRLALREHRQSANRLAVAHRDQWLPHRRRDQRTRAPDSVLGDEQLTVVAERTNLDPHQGFASRPAPGA
jgi:phytoene dehydrogenase-like protein